jgi:hypothetical protein
MGEVEEGVKRYRAKLDHTRLRNIFNQLIPQIVGKGKIAVQNNMALNVKVKRILDAYGVDPDHRIYYYAYARRLDFSQRTYRYMVDRIREHTILRNKYEGRGLNPDVLDDLDKVLIWNKSNP